MQPLASAADPMVGDAAPTAQAATPAEVFERLRRDAVIYETPFGTPRDADAPGPRVERLKFFPFRDAWPKLPTTVLVPGFEKLVDVSKSDLGDYVPDRQAAWSFSRPLTTDILPIERQSLLFLNGITSTGGVVASNYANVLVEGSMAGTLTMQVYGYILVHGKITGTVHGESYCGVIVHGPMTGTIDLASVGSTLYLLGGLGGSVHLPHGGRVYVAGRTTEADVRAHVSGDGYDMWLESSDLAPGTHIIGNAKVIVLGGTGTQNSAEAASDVVPHVTNQQKPLLPANTPGLSDVVDIACDDLRVGGDADRRYLLLNAAKPDVPPPAAGYRLLLILPGGDGSPDFNPFCKRIVKFAVPPGYIVAQLIAPDWTPDQAKNIVWPLGKEQVPGARFSTEEFMESVIAEIAAKRKIDRRYIFALGWSSGGLPVYAEALSPKTSLTGAFVAMSVFPQQVLPSLDGAKGKAFYIFHSTGDFIPIAQAENARDQLTANGAQAMLKTTTGGHGWFGDVYGNIRQGLAYLEANAVTRP